MEISEEFSITPERMLSIHREQALERMRSQRTVLVVQDGRDLKIPNEQDMGQVPVMTFNRIGLNMPRINEIEINEGGNNTSALACYADC